MDFGIWCNGSTLDFGSDNPGSIPGIPTKPTRRFPGKNLKYYEIQTYCIIRQFGERSGFVN